ncbi:MAG: VOC family protein [Enterococcus sp.]
MDIYLNFTNQAQGAMNFYAEIFDVPIEQVMTYGEMPEADEMNLDDATKKLIMNAQMTIDGTIVMFSDVPKGMAEPVITGNNVSLVIEAQSAEEATQLFNRLAVGGTIQMPLEKTFWASLYGMLTDKFGIIWQINLD